MNRTGLRRSRVAISVAMTVAVASLLTSDYSGKEPAVAATPPPAPAPPVVPSPSPTPTPPPEPRALNGKKLTRALDRYLRGRPVSFVMRDLETGVTYRYRPKERFVTASTAKVDIVMTLLRQKQKRHKGLSSYERSLADSAIRYSDNQATDRLWELVGGPGGVATANRGFGLRSTRTSGGMCLDLYCWGITDTTAEEQIRLLSNLVREDGPLNARNRAYVLGLMSKVIKEQAWGVSAAARKGDKVALKNGWQRRLAHGGLWAINSIGRVRTDGHDFLIAILSDHHATTGAGIVMIEHVVELAAAEFRATTPWIR
ncbi:MAG: serine hydrolase [Actinomadura sp.]